MRKTVPITLQTMGIWAVRCLVDNPENSDRSKECVAMTWLAVRPEEVLLPGLDGGVES